MPPVPAGSVYARFPPERYPRTKRHDKIPSSSKRYHFSTIGDQMLRLLKLFPLIFLIGISNAQEMKTIVFVSGPKDHGRMGNSRHEYEKDLAVLKYCIDNAGLKEVRTVAYNGKAPSMRVLNN